LIPDGQIQPYILLYYSFHAQISHLLSAFQVSINELHKVSAPSEASPGNCVAL